MVGFGSQIQGVQGDEPGEAVMLDENGQVPGGNDVKNLFDGYVIKPYISSVANHPSASFSEKEDTYKVTGYSPGTSKLTITKGVSDYETQTSVPIGDISIDVFTKVADLRLGITNSSSSTTYTITGSDDFSCKYVTTLEEVLSAIPGLLIIKNPSGVDYRIDGNVSNVVWKRPNISPPGSATYPPEKRYSFTIEGTKDGLGDASSTTSGSTQFTSYIYARNMSTKHSYFILESLSITVI